MKLNFTHLFEIRYRNLKIWLHELFERENVWKQLFDYRMVWGAFSIYSHRRRSDGKPNITFSTRMKAVKAATDMQLKYGVPFSAYKCLYCDGWHVGKCARQSTDQRKGTAPLPPPTLNVNQLPTELNVDMIMQSGIPDLARAYGGFRGRTLSSPRQASAWIHLVQGGIRQIIDLRADYSSEGYARTCKNWGIEYYHYPIAHDDESIRRMVEGFPEFCRLIDEGRFYIACAMGLHRTDIALCLYWVFYGADHGLPLPERRGYIRETGHNCSKIIRMLDHVYEAMYEAKGYKPISEELFIERKQQIITSF